MVLANRCHRQNMKTSIINGSEVSRLSVAIHEAMIPLPSGTKIWLVAGITDMRNGFNGLAAKVQMALKDDPMSGHVFIFRGRSGSQVKLLWSTGDGLCLLTKRLERGRFAWPSARDGKVFLTPAQLAMLLEGIDWRQPKRLLTSLTML